MTSVANTAYTPLESLLLFQALRADGIESISFNNISSDLQKIPLVTADPSYDAGRLSPEALKELYLGLLKEEVKRDLEKQLGKDDESHVTNGDVSPGSRKRKAPSPSLPTVREAAQHAHLIPQLVMRLYARYRENIVRDIRESERRYDAAVRDAEEIRVGRQDEQLRKQQAAPATQSPKPSVTAHTQPAVNRRDYAQQPISASASPAQSQPPADVSVQPPPKRYSTAKIDDVINHGPGPQENHGPHRRTSSNTALPSLSEMAPESHLGFPPGVGPPYGVNPPPNPQAVSYPPYPTHQGPGAVGSPRLPHNVSRPSSSPRMLPPPNGMPAFQPPAPLPGSPSMHGAPPNMQVQQHYQQQTQPYSPHRMSAGSTTPHGQPRSYPPPQAQPPQYYQQQPYQDRRTPYANPQPYPNHVYQAQPAPLQYQPKPSGPQTPHQTVYPQQQNLRGQHTPQPPLYPRRQPVAPANAPRPQPQPRPHSGLMSNILAALATPPRQPQQTPSTLWKSQRSFNASVPGSVKAPGSPERPPIEPLSPVESRAPVPFPSTHRAPDPVAEPIEAARPMAEPPKRGARKGGRRAREGSIGSSTMDGSLRRTRSRSIASVPASEDRPVSRRQVKNEPSTPADIPADIEESERASETGPVRRTRRGTLNTLPPPSSKRKRQASLENDPEATPEPPAPPKTTITATRNFAKMASTIMNDIVSHKHGSRFAHAVRDRDAEGYSDIIKRPQDLKSIRTVITAGARAIAAATQHTEGSPSSSSAKPADGSVVELERSADLMPPKAIVNGAQLEKEVMRMLANAVMFNPGEDGMVSDTREMFDDVERRMAEWRGAERELGGEEEGEGTGKRRKL